MTPPRTTLPELAAAYDAFLIDQFGVLLDGAAAYPWAPAALDWLGRTGKPVILLSNSGKRSAPNAARLDRLGFRRDSYRLVMSSGEAAFAHLAARLAPGTPVWLHAREEDRSAIDGLDLRETSRPEDAALLILAGSQADALTLGEYEQILAPAALRGIPMLCTNPDLEMLTPLGRRPGAGRIAQLYAELGAPVELIGKPHPLIYHEAARLLPGIPAGRILCLGDSVEHDILGGQRAGHATALVMSGLHHGAGADALARLFDAAGAAPDHIIDRFDITGA